MNQTASDSIFLLLRRNVEAVAPINSDSDSFEGMIVFPFFMQYHRGKIGWYKCDFFTCLSILPHLQKIEKIQMLDPQWLVPWVLITIAILPMLIDVGPLHALLFLVLIWVHPVGSQKTLA